MKRYLLSILLILLICVSCASLNEKNDKPSEEESEAVETLLGDMASSLSSFSLSIDVLEGALPESYTTYSDYIPSYENIRERYLSLIIEIIDEDLKTAFIDCIKGNSSYFSANPSSFIKGELIATYLEENEFGTVLSSFLSVIENKKDELDIAFNESKVEYERIKTAYDNLSQIDIFFSLPEAEPIDMYKLAALVATRYFEILKESEIAIRDNPLYSGTIYRLFWSAGK